MKQNLSINRLQIKKEVHRNLFLLSSSTYATDIFVRSDSRTLLNDRKKEARELKPQKFCQCS